MLLTLHKGLQPQPPFPWLLGAWQSIVSQAEDHRLPHALLITGRQGVGGSDFALAAAQYLLCIAPTNQSACGKCKSCLLLAADAHPDLQILVPDGQGKPIKIDQVRQVAEFVAQTAQQGGRKLVIIYPAERMNLNAANALLKSLEEPSGDCVFLLVSESPALLLATIRSRCQRLDLQRPPTAVALNWLEQRGIADASKRLEEADGCPLRVLAWLEGDVYGQRLGLREVLMRVLSLEHSPAEATRALLKFDPAWVLDELMRTLADAAKPVTDGASDASEGDALVGQLSRRRGLRLFALYGKLLQSKRMLLSGANPNVELMFNDILIDLSAVATKSS